MAVGARSGSAFVEVASVERTVDGVTFHDMTPMPVEKAHLCLASVDDESLMVTGGQYDIWNETYTDMDKVYLYR